MRLCNFNGDKIGTFFDMVLNLVFPSYFNQLVLLTTGSVVRCDVTMWYTLGHTPSRGESPRNVPCNTRYDYCTHHRRSCHTCTMVCTVWTWHIPWAPPWNTRKASEFHWTWHADVPRRMHGIHPGLAVGQPIGRPWAASYRACFLRKICHGPPIGQAV